MGKKAGKYRKKEADVPAKNKSRSLNLDDDDMMNDEIDAFHKNRDVVPLNMNDDVEESDEDDEQPVFDFENDDDQDEEDEDDDDGDYEEDDVPPKGLEAQIVRTQKYLRANFGGVDDEDDADEEEKGRLVWGRKKDLYGADVDEPQSSDDEDAAEEEAEVLKLQNEKAKLLSMEDFGLGDSSQDERDHEPTFEELLHRGKPPATVSREKEIKPGDDMTYEIVKKDLNALTKEEQMDVVYSSAPELIGLLSELNDAMDQLENKVTPLVNKIKGLKNARKGGLHYLEVKQLLLQCFCQTITFYLLLKSEGHPVRDHPVISRLELIKNLVDKIKEIDENLPVDMDNILNVDVNDVAATVLDKEILALESDSATNRQTPSAKDTTKQDNTLDAGTKNQMKNEMQQHHVKQVGEQQSMEMLKLRAALEERLKKKGVLTSVAPKKVAGSTNLQPVNRQLETLDDFDDETMEVGKLANGSTNRSSQQLPLRPNKRKAISGDDDVPKRDDIGERRRKHELRVLSRAGVKSGDDGDDMEFDIEKEDESGNDGDDNVEGESDDDDAGLEFYRNIERQHAAKHAAKSEKYSRTSELPSLPDDNVEGKRLITRQIEKNRGLTRSRKKLTKNPRKKYKLKHQKAQVRRKGQVREIRKPDGPYGGEATGINAGISRSIRFKN